MTDHDGNTSNPYKPSPEHCCEACVFGSGEHAVWCWEHPAWIATYFDGSQWVVFQP